MSRGQTPIYAGAAYNDSDDSDDDKKKKKAPAKPAQKAKSAAAADDEYSGSEEEDDSTAFNQVPTDARAKPHTGNGHEHKPVMQSVADARVSDIVTFLGDNKWSIEPGQFRNAGKAAPFDSSSIAPTVGTRWLIRGDQKWEVIEAGKSSVDTKTASGAAAVVNVTVSAASVAAAVQPKAKKCAQCCQECYVPGTGCRACGLRDEDVKRRRPKKPAAAKDPYKAFVNGGAADE